MITEEYLEELDLIFKSAIDNPDLLSTWENGFVNDFIENIEKYGINIKISDKQQPVIDKIENKLRKAGEL